MRERSSRLGEGRWLAVVMLIFGLLPTSSQGAAGDIGYQDQAYEGLGSAPSGSKPESKLWWNDGFWWGSLKGAGADRFRIFRLDPATQTWIDTGVPLDARPDSRADALWDGAYLYIASHVFLGNGSASGFPSRLYRFSYSPSTQSYSLDSGFPVSINDYKTETLVIAKDSTGMLWATWTQNSQIYVNHTLGNDLLWGTPFVLPVAGTSVNADDISSVVNFGGNKIGVMWSNQIVPAVYFTAHVDGQPDTVWQATQTAAQGPNIADDHINLKGLQADGSGRIFAAVKTSLSSPSAVGIALLVWDPVSGLWSSYTFGRLSDQFTRPIVLLDEESGMIHLFATSGMNGGTIYEKTSPINSISFPVGLGTPVIQDGASANMNNATSTKQNLNSTTGLVVLATNDTTQRYWHAYEALPCSNPTAEICDGFDNNCDGRIDEGFDVGTACTAGVGYCQASGVKVCTADHTATVCNAVPGTPVTEICDGIDNNCDGSVDEGGDAWCADASACTTDTCGGSSGCLHAAVTDGTICTDDNSCTQTDSCQAGVCIGANPVVCVASDACHDAGVCDTATGVCSNPAKADGAVCSDGNSCTQTDACQAGVCVGANPVVCDASDTCHDAGVCDTATGICSNPAKADGAVCTDGNPCTTSDTCLAGSCMGGPLKDGDADGRVDTGCGGNDCNDANPLVWLPPAEVSGLVLSTQNPADPTWTAQDALAGPETTYDLVSGPLPGGAGFTFASASCLQAGTGSASYSDSRPDPVPDTGFWYLVRARNSCGTATYGTAQRDAEIPACP